MYGLGRARETLNGLIRGAVLYSPRYTGIFEIKVYKKRDINFKDARIVDSKFVRDLGQKCQHHR